jgi:hypothetical protein
MIAYATPAQCRRAVVPGCDPIVAITGSVPPMIGEVILLKKGDIIDVGIDWSAWLEQNGGELTSSSFAAHGSSPAAPVFQGVTTGIDDGRKHTVCLINTSAAVLDAVYWLNNTIIVAGAPSGTYTMPSRTLTRTIAVKVVA